MRINIRVRTGSKVEQVKKAGSLLEIKVKARPIDGKANQEVVRLLSEFLSVSRSLIKIKSGLKSKNKVVEILG